MKFLAYLCIRERKYATFRLTNCQNGRKQITLMTKIPRLLALLFIACCFLPPLAARPKVGVVLSGGGAKGTAHIGALRVMEEAGVPIDIIVGTSMGSIIGGLYSIGYTPDQMDSIFMAQDWPALLGDKSHRSAIDLQAREQGSQYILSVPFFEKPQDLISGGLIKGRNIGRMLWQLTEGYHDSIDFRKMPIPFACVSQDLVTGKEVVFRNGVLPIAIRASMSIPGVFAPVDTNGLLLIDGGITNNYPVDVALDMGADIIIGVDVQDPLKNADELKNNLFSQLNQLIDLQRKDRWQQSIDSSDVYIKVNVKGYSTASFNITAIDSLIGRGEQAARLQMDTLRAIARRLAPATDNPAAHRPVPPYYYMHRPGGVEARYAATIKTLVGDAPTNSINLGLRFDNEELAALLFNGQMQLGRKRNHNVSLTLRLGKQTSGDAHYALHMGRQWLFTTGYRYTYNDFNIYEKGEREYGLNINHHFGEVGFMRSWKYVRLKLGAIYQLYNYGSFLYRFSGSSPRDINKESYMKFGTEYAVSTANDAYFPTKGSEFALSYYYAIPLNGNKAFHIAGIHWNAAFSFNSRFTLMPWVDSRYLTTENTVAEINTIGGQERGKYFAQQIPLYGINYFEMARRSLAIVGIEARQRIGGKHYVSGAFNVAATSDDWMHFFKNSFGNDERMGYHVFGGAIRYDIRTFIGPVGITFSYSDRSKFSGYFRAGFNF